MKTKKASSPGQFKCDQPDCGKTFTYARVLGAHKRIAHGIAGSAKSTLSKWKNREVKAAANTNPLQCPHCAFVAKTQGGWKLHLMKKHGRVTTPSNGKDTQLVKRTTQAVTLNGHVHEEGQDHHNANGIPDALIALATGRFQELCRSMAFEHDLPPRMFAARVAAFVYASQVR